MIKNIIINNLNIPFYIKDNKSKNTLVVIHGFESSYRTAYNLDNVDNNYNIVSFSLPGTKDVKTESVTIDILIKTINAAMKHVKNSKVYLLGHSFGGYLISQIKASQYANKIFLLNPVHPNIVHKRSWNILKKLLKPEKGNSISSKIISQSLKLVPKEVSKKIDKFVKTDSSWFNIVEEVLLDKNIIHDQLNEMYHQYKDKSYYILSKKDSVIGTRHIKKYLEEYLKKDYVVIGSFHSPLKLYANEINDYLNSEIPFKKRWLPKWRKIVK